MVFCSLPTGQALLFSDDICSKYIFFQDQGLKKVPASHPGQVDYLARQVTFHSPSPDGQGPIQVICQLNNN